MLRNDQISYNKSSKLDNERTVHPTERSLALSSDQFFAVSWLKCSSALRVQSHRGVTTGRNRWTTENVKMQNILWSQKNYISKSRASSDVSSSVLQERLSSCITTQRKHIC